MAAAALVPGVSTITLTWTRGLLESQTLTGLPGYNRNSKEFLPLAHPQAPAEKSKLSLLQIR
eukprot:1969895-Rhodomonas_salina.3